MLEDSVHAEKHAVKVAQEIQQQLANEKAKHQQTKMELKVTREKLTKIERTATCLSNRENELIRSYRSAIAVEKSVHEVALNLMHAVATKRLLPESHETPMALTYEVIKRTLCQIAGRAVPRKISDVIANWSMVIFSEYSGSMLDKLNANFAFMSSRQCHERIKQQVRKFEYGVQEPELQSMIDFAAEMKKGCTLSLDELFVSDQF